MNKEQVRKFVEEHKKPYAYLQNLGLALMDWLGFEQNPFSNEKKRINCVEIVALLLKEAGYSLPANPDSLDLNNMLGIMESLVKLGKARKVDL